MHYGLAASGSLQKQRLSLVKNSFASKLEIMRQPDQAVHYPPWPPFHLPAKTAA